MYASLTPTCKIDSTLLGTHFAYSVSEQESLKMVKPEDPKPTKTKITKRKEEGLLQRIHVIGFTTTEEEYPYYKQFMTDDYSSMTFRTPKETVVFFYLCSSYEYEETYIVGLHESHFDIQASDEYPDDSDVQCENMTDLFHIKDDDCSWVTIYTTIDPEHEGCEYI